MSAAAWSPLAKGGRGCPRGSSVHGGATSSPRKCALGTMGREPLAVTLGLSHLPHASWFGRSAGPPLGGQAGQAPERSLRGVSLMRVE